jgi:hypothetical protein
MTAFLTFLPIRTAAIKASTYSTEAVRVTRHCCLVLFLRCQLQGIDGTTARRWLALERG